jgi:hypothetical protein
MRRFWWDGGERIGSCFGRDGERVGKSIEDRLDFGDLGDNLPQASRSSAEKSGVSCEVGSAE